MTDRGSVSVLMLALLALAALLCLATADAAAVLMARARAQAGADAAALAAAAAQWPLSHAIEDPQTAARQAAEANGTELDGCDCPRRATSATVRVSRPTHVRMLGVAPRRVSATARAEVDAAAVFRRP